MKITRREMVKGLAAGTVATVGAAMLGGCAANKGTVAKNSENTEAETDPKATETISCDIVIVGAGMSGLACGVQACLNGANTIIVESQSSTGGSGTMTDCIGAVGSADQQAGIINASMPDQNYTVVINGEVDHPRPTKTDLTPYDIIEHEMETFNYNTDGDRWYDLWSNSGKNIAWIKEQGALLQTGVDNYQGEGKLNTCHWWKDGLGGGLSGYVEPMTTKFSELGGRILLETPAIKIAMNDSGEATGVYVQSKNGVVLVEAKATVIATGGFTDNKDMLEQIGFDPDVLEICAAPGHNGDGINMAIEAGAKSWMNYACLLQCPQNTQMSLDSSVMCSIPFSIWVNDRGNRYADENRASHCPDRGSHCQLAQNKSWTIMDHDIHEKLCGMREDIAAYVKKCTDEGALISSNSVEGLAQSMGVDTKAFSTTIETYNAACKVGVDSTFGKDAACLLPLATPPFYAMENCGVYTVTTIGGISTTVDTEVRSADGGVISHLFAIGIDGAELWRGLYTLDVPGSLNANNINTGRRAANKACELL